jgi:dCMP deaminase
MIKKKDLFEGWEKPSWDDYFMSIALLVGMRSIDPSAKYGSVIVGKDNKILSIGYNGPPRGMKDEKLSMSRPQKYLIMEHAEKNAILNKQFSIDGSTLYVMAMPCVNCLRSIIQSGIKKVIHGNFKSRAIGPENEEVIKMMIADSEIEVVEYKGDLLHCINRAKEYFEIKSVAEKKKSADFGKYSYGN